MLFAPISDTIDAIIESIDSRMESETSEGGTATGHALPELLFGRARARLFAVLFVLSERAFYFRELARVTGLSTSSLRRGLLPLLRAGIVEQRGQANLVYYRANPSHPCFPELKGLLDKTAGIAPQLQASLLPLADRIDYAFIYGSHAGGSATATSDIDLMVVGSASFGEVVDVVRPVAERIGRPISPTLYGAKEFRRQLADGHSFLHAVLDKPRVDLIGVSDELAESRQPGPARAAPKGARTQRRSRSAAERR
jgi:DNA-binding transcriptional ArsR family regulator